MVGKHHGLAQNTKMVGDATTWIWYVAEVLNADILAWIEIKLFYFAARLQAMPYNNI